MKRSFLTGAVAGVSLIVAHGAFAEGLKLAPRESTAEVWPQWQARRTVLANPGTPLSLWSSSGGESGTSTLLVGDYFFARPAYGWWPSGGQLRASTGLVLSSRIGHGLRTPDAGSSSGSSLPYVGLGYSGLSAKRHGAGWSISADLGLTADTRGVGKLLGSQGFDHALRELRFAPVVQVGVRYAF